MQSRRQEEFEPQSTFVRGRRNTDVGPDAYLMMPPQSNRSWSPRRMEGSLYSERVVGGGHRRSSSMERRRVVDDGSRRVRSRSPPFMEAKRGGSFYNDDYVIDRDLASPERGRRFEFFDHVDMNRDEFDSRNDSRMRNEFDSRNDSRMRNEFGYNGGSSRTAMIVDKFEGRMREMVNQKSAAMGLYKSTGAVGPTSMTERGGVRVPESLNTGLGQLGKERVQYPDFQDPVAFNKYTATKQYGEGEKNIVRMRDAPYSNLTAIRPNESMGTAHFEDYARTSPRKPRVEHLGYRGDMPLPRDNYPSNSANIRQPLSPSRYGQRQHLDPDLDINKDMTRFRHEPFSPPPPRTGNLDSLRHQRQIQESDEYLYPAEEKYEKMNLRDHVTQRAEASDFARGNISNRGSWDHRSVEKLTAANNIHLSRSPLGKREGGQYLDTASVHSRLGRKISREQEMLYMGMAQDREITHMGVDYDLKREVGAGSHKERMRSSPGPLYDTERLRLAERGHDLSLNYPSNRFLKRKYTMEDEQNRINSRTMTGRLDTVSRRHERDYRDEEWIDQDTRDSSFPKRRGFSRRVDKTYDGTDTITEEWYPEEPMHDHAMKSYTYEDKYAKGYSRSSVRGGYNSYNPNRRNVLPKWKNESIRGENDDEVDMYSGEIEQYEDWAIGATKSDPPEDSEEFKKLVHDFFLTFTKKLNETPGVRRRYMEQGRAGSLFCIVCGRSLSKEFLDAQRLATHAFMSHKTGLRAQHLGLHKAICVMLGWSSTILPETITWYPDTLSSSESLAQKQDLIIWPPVIIIHNISISTNNPNSQGPTTVEALGQFLRIKGLSGSGKVKPGKPANCSIMLVKFLGTFSGLKDAKKIHEYFSKNKHGRTDLEQITSGKGKSKGSEGENKNGGEKEEGEDVVYGYMGIAEDLDKVDFDTKRKCSIKSKKEIQDLADAPVKPE